MSHIICLELIPRAGGAKSETTFGFKNMSDSKGTCKGWVLELRSALSLSLPLFQGIKAAHKSQKRAMERAPAKIKAALTLRYDLEWTGMSKIWEGVWDVDFIWIKKKKNQIFGPGIVFCWHKHSMNLVGMPWMCLEMQQSHQAQSYTFVCSVLSTCWSSWISPVPSDQRCVSPGSEELKFCTMAVALLCKTSDPCAAQGIKCS